MTETSDSLVSLFQAQAERLGDRLFLRFKEQGSWKDLSWRDLARATRGCAAGLQSLGCRFGDRVVVLSENRSEWVISDLGLMTAGAINVPIHAPLAAKQIAYQVADSGAAVVLVSTGEQLDKIVQATPDCPNVKHVVAFDKLDSPSGVGWTLHQFHDLLAQDSSDHAFPSVSASDLATIMYTSGTTGEPKGVMLSHGNILSNAQATLAAVEIDRAEVKLVWLPISHIFARTVDYYLVILAGGVMALTHGPEHLMEDLQAVQPHMMSSVPHFYENIVRALTAQGKADDPRVLQAMLGGRMKRCVSGGAPLPPHLAEFFNARGVPVLEGYGLTESSPVICSNTPAANKVGTVGRPIPGVEVRVAEDGELLTRGPHVMQGYWNKPEATTEAIQDGWLYTGDLASIDEDGFVSITGRKKDIIVTAGGKNIAPRFIEHLLSEDPLIHQAVVFGDRRKFLTAVIVPSFDVLREEAKRLGITEHTPEALIAEPKIKDLYDARIRQTLKDVSKFEQVREFILAPHEFSISSGHLTPTLKVRRERIYQDYRTQIDTLYAG